MKQIALSLFVITASGAYVWDQTDRGPADDMLGSALPADAAEVPSTQPNEPGIAAGLQFRTPSGPVEVVGSWGHDGHGQQYAMGHWNAWQQRHGDDGHRS